MFINPVDHLIHPEREIIISTSGIDDAPNNYYGRNHQRYEDHEYGEFNKGGGLCDGKYIQDPSSKRTHSPFDQVCNVSITILQIYKKNSKNQFTGTIEESWLNHLND